MANIRSNEVLKLVRVGLPVVAFLSHLSYGFNSVTNVHGNINMERRQLSILNHCDRVASQTSLFPLPQQKCNSTPSNHRRLHAATTSDLFQPQVEQSDDGDLLNYVEVLDDNRKAMNPIKAAITKAGMMSFIASMCLALPITLFPVAVLYRAHLISKTQKEHYSLHIGQFFSRWLMRIFPFAKLNVIGNHSDIKGTDEPKPTVWVCNHTSMLDVFVLLAVDKRLRGENKRPLKIIYWKDLENNPITRILFTMSGFISVEMEDNGNGNPNSYKTSSFKVLLKNIKTAFDEGFDIGILPEGQLNPTPENGLQPVFPGAFTLARMSRRPIRMIGLHGLHRLWHPKDSIGMTVTGRDVSIRAYPAGKKFESADEFIATFSEVIGHFGAYGKDLRNWEEWMDGTAWAKSKEDDEIKTRK